VRDCLLFFSRLQNISKKEAQKKISFWLNKFSLREKEKSKVEELSKGLQQKLQLIIALISEPPLIILDEPFSGLDPLSEAVARDVILEMNKKGHAFILSTHRMENVESLCTHVVFLNKGKVLLDGKVEEIKEKFSENLYEVTGEGTLSNDVNTYSLLSRKQEKNVIVAQLKAKNNTDSNEIIRELLPDFKIQSFKRQTPDIESIFFRLIKDDEK
jgi:ABC-2 type transport system ATP-binding protein